MSVEFSLRFHPELHHVLFSTSTALGAQQPGARLRLSEHSCEHKHDDREDGPQGLASIGWGLGLGQLADFYHFSAITGSCQLLPF